MLYKLCVFVKACGWL